MVDLVGSKAANLGILLHAGFNIPEGIVLTINAFNQFLSVNKLSHDTKSINSPQNLIFPKEVETELIEFKELIENHSLAVRSSAIEEDLLDQSFAGMYKTILDVKGHEALKKAIIECWLSTFDERVSHYKNRIEQSNSIEISVIIQKLVDADSAGVVFSINPHNRNHDEIVISAVRGLGEKLVSGESQANEWIVCGEKIKQVNHIEPVLDDEQIIELARTAKLIENEFNLPQDIEWAYSANTLFILQSRPISIVYEEVEWDLPKSGLWLRNFRLGEWLDNPVTPLFASWLLPKLDNKLYSNLEKILHIPTPKPYHIIVNGWYFATGNFLPKNPLDAIWKLFRYILPSLIFKPRRMAILIPKISYWGIKLYEKEWREQILPEYLALIENYQSKITESSLPSLFDMIEEITEIVGTYFYSLITVAGSAWKPEFKFANYYNKNIAPSIDEDYQILLQGLGTATSEPYDHAVTNLDWYHPTLGELIKSNQRESVNNSAVVKKRINLRRNIEQMLEKDPKTLKKFNQLLNEAQETALMREEQIYYFTLAWPLMREILLTMGDYIEQQGKIAQASDIFFLEKEELQFLVLSAEPSDLHIEIEQRKKIWKNQCNLQPPMYLGKMSFIAQRIFENYERSDIVDKEVLIKGLAASPGKITGKVRIIDSLENAHQFQEGEILVTRATNPAWTILFSKAIAVITDVGSPMAHASLVAREYGIPAVVGTGNGTSILKTGQLVMVNGNTGVVKEIS